MSKRFDPLDKEEFLRRMREEPRLAFIASLGVARSTFYRLVARMGLPREAYRKYRILSEEERHARWKTMVPCPRCDLPPGIPEVSWRKGARTCIFCAEGLRTPHTATQEER